MIRIVRKKGESIDSMLKRYKRSRIKADLPFEIKKREFYKKPSEKRREKHLKAVHRQSKLSRQNELSD